MTGEFDLNVPLPEAIQGPVAVDDPTREDSFQREGLTGLAIDPDGNFRGFDVKFESQFTRTDQA